MDVNVLKARIEAVKTKIEKIQKRIQKHQDNQDEAHFIKYQAPWYTDKPKDIKTMDDLVQARWNWIDSKYENDPNPKYHMTIEDTRNRIERDFKDYVAEEQREVRSAQKDLEEQKALLDKYESQLGVKDEFVKSDKIEVIWQFLQNWKEDTKKFIIENATKIPELKANEAKAWEEYKERHNITEHSLWYKKGFQEKYYAEISPLTWKLYEGKGKVDEAKLEQILTEEVEAKYKRFIAQIMGITGDIIDASGLRIAGSGDINGFVKGVNGNCAVWSTLAGWYYGNGNGLQAPHFRLFIRRRD